MAEKKTRQAKRAAEHQAVQEAPAKEPVIYLALSLQEAKIIGGGLGKLPIEVALGTLNKVQAAVNAALTVKPKGN